jgi:hypothetical protein
MVHLVLEDLVKLSMPPGNTATVIEALSLRVMVGSEQIDGEGKFALFRKIMNIELRMTTSCGNQLDS